MKLINKIVTRAEHQLRAMYPPATFYLIRVKNEKRVKLMSGNSTQQRSIFAPEKYE
jgi:hypothetical protein